jgi:uncharacterized protein involved in exopolysaccharide biosynthesis
MMNQNTPEDYANLISFSEVKTLLLEKKKFLISITALFTILSSLYAFISPNIYVSSSLLAPANQDGNLSSRFANYGALASIAGADLSGESASPSVEGVERIKSLSFFTNYFLPEIKLEDLFAIKSWNPDSNKIKYNKDIFDQDLNKWTREVDSPRKVIPSNQEAYEIYLNILSITQDPRTQYVTISISSQSPSLAKAWLDIIITNINESMRNEDKLNATNSISFLNEISEQTQLTEIKDAIAQLLEKQMQTLMLASASEYYIYKYIDYPYIPELKSFPRRGLIILLGFLIGFISGIFFIFIGRIK